MSQQCLLLQALFPPSTRKAVHSVLEARAGMALSAIGVAETCIALLPVPFRTLSAGLTGLPLQLEEKIFRPSSLFFQGQNL